MSMKIVGVFSVLLLAACGGGGGGSEPTPEESVTPATPSITSVQEFADSADQFDATILNVANRAQATNIPTSGSATYNGRVSADYAGDITGSLLGDMSMTAQFDSLAISGTIDELVASDGADVFDVGGELTIDGAFAGSDIQASATGALMLPTATGASVSSDTGLEMFGVFLGPSGTPTAVNGAMTGGTVNGVAITLDQALFYGIK
ncbi:hypothetical protein [Actibacterium lipolyticum]|uniref:Transferrin-binding protein B C-lobe/N-lobe beta barrel domain-containing protein n=1 Tax=Actibacterium lipolyticum TaxID=1524263 RepID=A0A238JK88_9RHOB|nr:hypothetical protein [Actibacterium lipolyticum]SMX30905.1 hypothetical protein COL8621_00179 [Actibacterium lipolyticum]